MSFLDKFNPFKKKEAGDLSYKSPEWRKLHYRGTYFSTRITKRPDEAVLIIMRRNSQRYQALVDRFNAKYFTCLHWLDVAIIHALECSSDFGDCLHNGETLINVNIHGTRLEPKGRGKGMNWSWEDAAFDALEIEYKEGKLFPKTMKIEEHLFFLEQYNGLGYLKFHSECPSPYLWGYTGHYIKGKYKESLKDGVVWDPTLVSLQCGAAAYYLTLGDPLI